MFTYTPLLGAQTSSPASQSILEFDGGVKILVDVGWDETFDTKLLIELEKYASSSSKLALYPFADVSATLDNFQQSHSSSLHTRQLRISAHSLIAASRFLYSLRSQSTLRIRLSRSAERSFKISMPPHPLPLRSCPSPQKQSLGQRSELQLKRRIFSYNLRRAKRSPDTSR